MSIRLIAEASTNHGGSLDTAIRMAEEAKAAGADTIKFQCVSPEAVPEAVRDWYWQCEFNKSQWRSLKTAVEATGLRFLCTPQTVEDFKLLLSIGITEVKVSSDNNENGDLLAAIEDADIDAIISLGMQSNEFCLGGDIAMICTSEYPCAPEGVRLLSKYALLCKSGAHEWGFSDHTQGSTAAILAMGMGARVFEKHFRIEAPDTCNEPWACNPLELKSYFDHLKLAWTMLGEGLPAVTEAEVKLREELGLG